MADIFLSYAREDKPRAAQVAAGLEAMGIDVFWDNEIPPGQTWPDYIESKLNLCRAVVVLWSANSTRSQYVREEAREGRNRGQLFPAMIDASPPPFGFGEVQSADLSTWNGDAQHSEWRRFTQAIYAFIKGEGSVAPAAPAPALATAPAYAAATTASAAPVNGSEQLSPVGYIAKCFRLYFNGTGRARRAEYWWWTAFTILLSLVSTAIDASLGANPYSGQPNNQIASLVVGLAVLSPGIAVASRRFHDVGMSGWLVAPFVLAYFLATFLLGLGNAQAMATGNFTMSGLAVLILLVAGGAQLVITLIPSQRGPNQYGPNPKGQ